MRFTSTNQNNMFLVLVTSLYLLAFVLNTTVKVDPISDRAISHKFINLTCFKICSSFTWKTIKINKIIPKFSGKVKKKRL
jgi:hypothetical protein